MQFQKGRNLKLKSLTKYYTGLKEHYVHRTVQYWYNWCTVRVQCIYGVSGICRRQLCVWCKFLNFGLCVHMACAYARPLFKYNNILLFIIKIQNQDLMILLPKVLYGILTNKNSSTKEQEEWSHCRNLRCEIYSIYYHGVFSKIIIAINKPSLLAIILALLPGCLLWQFVFLFMC